MVTGEICLWSDQFTLAFWQAHREVRGMLLDLVQAGLNPIQPANEVERRSTVVAD
jgi:hypothetical protein